MSIVEDRIAIGKRINPNDKDDDSYIEELIVEMESDLERAMADMDRALLWLKVIFGVSVTAIVASLLSFFL